MKAVPAAVLFAAVSVSAGTLPGFRVHLLGSTSGFADSIAIDSRSTIYYTTTVGNLFRFGNGKSELVTEAPLPEWNGGKAFRLFPDGSVQQFARGFRNPFDLSDGKRTSIPRRCCPDLCAAAAGSDSCDSRRHRPDH